MIHEVLKGTNTNDKSFFGEHTLFGKELGKRNKDINTLGMVAGRVAPLWANDLMDITKEHSGIVASGLLSISFLGFGVNHQDTKIPNLNLTEWYSKLHDKPAKLQQAVIQKLTIPEGTKIEDIKADKLPGNKTVKIEIPPALVKEINDAVKVKVEEYMKRFNTSSYDDLMKKINDNKALSKAEKDKEILKIQNQQGGFFDQDMTDIKELQRYNILLKHKLIAPD